MSNHAQETNPLSTLVIRAERNGDQASIHAVIEQAFRGMPYADGDEADLVDHLRSARALVLSLVALLDGQIIGQIAFSPAIASDAASPWYALGPVAVLPGLQRAGIGAQLVETGLRQITAMGAAGCILTGNPRYYSRFGFILSPANVPPEEPAEFFMLRLLGGTLPTGPIRFHPAFYEET